MRFRTWRLAWAGGWTRDGRTPLATVKRTGSRKTLTTANLAALGAERLAELLIDVAEGHAQIKRRLRLELAGEVGPGDLVAELAKRIDSVADSRARVHWRKHKEFVRELDMIRVLIAGRLTALDPALALPLMIGFIDLAEGVFTRTQDAKGEVEAVFQAAVADVAAIAPLAKSDPRIVADQLFDLLLSGRAGLSTRVLQNALPALNAIALAALRARIETAMASQRRVSATLKAAIQVLADAQGDVDGYIAQFTDSQAVLPPIGAQIARRLMAAGRLDEALAALDRSTPGSFVQLVGAVLGRPSLPGPGALDWEEAYIDVLEARGQGDLAQDMRWAGFERGLSTERLRDYLKRLPDFDDVEAEDRALAHAEDFHDLHAALDFLVQWPAWDRAARLTLRRSGELDGDRPELLEPAARAIEGRHPLAATLLLRALILDTARYARTTRYKDAQRQLLEAASLAPAIADWGGHEDAEAFAARVAGFRRW
ncbi:hypothetical protein PMI01_02812 [Caulobacter sp. AP07]|nr:hypothetical protein PMI01_02812 [Caulobacter sp. AP07]